MDRPIDKGVFIKHMAEKENGRTHEPNLRELTSELGGMRDLTATRFTYVEKVMDERHQLYKERADSQKVAVDDALAAVKEQTSASFAASEKAIVKAEESQKTYNQGHNDLSRKMEAQYSLMVPQAEAKLKWDAIDKAIEESRRENATLRSNSLTDINALRVELMREIGSLRDTRSELRGRDTAKQVEVGQRTGSNLNSITLVGVVFATLLSIGTLVTSILLLKH